MIDQAKHIFKLSDTETEVLANSAGLSLQYKGGYIIDILGYQGKLRTLCSNAMVSDRMLRLYKKETPTKQVILALCVVLDKNINEINEILHKYGYCLSNSIISDVVVKWYIKTNSGKVSGKRLIFSINETLEKMGVPLLMTKQSGK